MSPGYGVKRDFEIQVITASACSTLAQIERIHPGAFEFSHRYVSSRVFARSCIIKLFLIIEVLTQFEYKPFQVPSNYNLEKLEKRREAITNKTPSPIDELQQLISQGNEPTANREPAVGRLKTILKTNPELVIDLLIDRRLFIRAAAELQAVDVRFPQFQRQLL
jgi:hypothetical protein